MASIAALTSFKNVGIMAHGRWYDYVVDPAKIRLMTPTEVALSPADDPIIPDEDGLWLKCSFLLRKDRLGTERQVVKIISQS